MQPYPEGEYSGRVLVGCGAGEVFCYRADTQVALAAAIRAAFLEFVDAEAITGSDPEAVAVLNNPGPYQMWYLLQQAPSDGTPWVCWRVPEIAHSPGWEERIAAQFSTSRCERCTKHVAEVEETPTETGILCPDCARQKSVFPAVSADGQVAS